MNASGYLPVIGSHVAGAVSRMSPDTLSTVSLKLALAVVLAGAVGIERERKGRAAGLRTHVLVCLGATLMMIIADRLAQAWGQTGAPVWLDQGRIAAGIITGIGFLGAGTIINVGSTQRGLTTAAMIWFIAAVGIAVGAGYYAIAILATAVALLVALCFEYLEGLLPSALHFQISVRMPGGVATAEDVEKAIRTEGYRVRESSLKLVGDGAKLDLTFEIQSPVRLKPTRLAELLRSRFDTIERIVITK